VVLRTPDAGLVRRLALRLGEDGRVVSPPDLAAEIRDAAAAALANYAELPALAPVRLANGTELPAVIARPPAQTDSLQVAV
jgi:hypothetical protein